MNQLVIYSEEELKRIQNIELKALKVIIAICSQLKIEYFVIGGTALGAIRHNGFIPWDDDIDIGMTRHNYDRFANEAAVLLPKGYYLQTPYNDNINPYPYMKVRVDGTKFVEYSNRKLNVHQGIYVDIFPFDEVPDNELAGLKQFNTVRKLVNIFSLRQKPDLTYEPTRIRDKIKSIIRHIVHYMTKIIPYSFLLSKIELKMKQYNGTNQKGLECLFFPKIKTEYALKSTLYPLKLHRFEDIDVYIPNDFDTYLTSHYGDYMKLPPESQRFGHKPYLVSFDE